MVTNCYQNVEIKLSYSGLFSFKWIKDRFLTNKTIKR